MKAVSVLIAIVALIVPGSILCEETDAILRELPDAKLSNCGMKVAMFVLDWYKASVEVERLENDLDVGHHWARPASLEQMKRIFESSGLTVNAFQDASIEDIVARIAENQVCLLHLQHSDTKEGHFLLFLARRRSEVFVVDAGNYQDWVTIDELRDKLPTAFSGYCLFISKSSSDSASLQYTLSEKSIEIDLGDIPNEPRTLVVPLAVVNTNQVPIIIEQTAGSCACFKEASFRGKHPARLEPGDTGLLEIKFDRYAMGTGDIQRHAILQLRDTGPRELEIRVSARIPHRMLEQRVVWFPTRIDYGLVRDRARLGKPQFFTVSLPKGTNIGQVTASSSNIVIKAAEEEAGDIGDGNAARRVCRFEVTVIDAQAGPLTEKISVSISDTNNPIIEIPLVGELVRNE